MNRNEFLLNGITKEMLGIECGPWKSPLVPKKEGFNSLVLDVFSRERLLDRALADPNIPQESLMNIEDVDLLGSSMDIEQLCAVKGIKAHVDYIISSHNFEHIPNPIKFIAGCASVLKETGVLVMAIPDYRYCFDHFRPRSTTGELLEAYFENETTPTYRQIFDHHTLYSSFESQEGFLPCFKSTDNPRQLRTNRNIKEAFESWKKMIKSADKTYHDVHCWTFTPESSQLIISDITFIGLTQLSVDEISETYGCEFYVRLRKKGGLNTKDFYENRQNILYEL